MSGLDYIQVIRRITPWSTADHGNELTWVPFYTNWRTAIVFKGVHRKPAAFAPILQ
jgi:hypothetical protein